MKDLKKEIQKLAVQLNLAGWVPCDQEETKQCISLEENKLPLPNNIKNNDCGEYVKYVECDISDEELVKLLSFRKVKYLKTIRNILIFFAVLVGVSTLISIISLTTLSDLLSEF